MGRIVPVILCGGSGTRLWPRSRAAKPKPFLPLLGERTLYQDTLARCSDRGVFAAPMVVIGEQHLDHARTQAADIAPDAIFIVEPTGRNTAPAVALAARSVDPDDIMLVCPSDHFIADASAFRRIATEAAALARSGWLVCFGISATAPETGYGYLRRDEALEGGYRVQKFVEKPELETAIGFLADGGYAWNGGIFALPAGPFLEELATHRPEMARRVEEAHAKAQRSGSCLRPDREAFAAIAGESIDYAIMENTDRAAMVDAAFGWSDIGNWNAIYDHRKPADGTNVIVGQGEIIDSEGTMIDTDGPFVTVVGVSDVVVVVDGEDVLVASRDAAQQVGNAHRSRNQ